MPENKIDMADFFAHSPAAQKLIAESRVDRLHEDILKTYLPPLAAEAEKSFKDRRPWIYRKLCRNLPRELRVRARARRMFDADHARIFNDYAFQRYRRYIDDSAAAATIDERRALADKYADMQEALDRLKARYS